MNSERRGAETRGHEPRGPESRALDALRIEPLNSLEAFEACIRLQETIWGPGFDERVPGAILRIAAQFGGVLAGAFDDALPGAPMVGFVFGLTGVEDGALVHWSDMLAVVPSHRGRGIGFALKVWQARHLRPLGVKEVRWTFDPLEAGNAMLNLVRLGGEAWSYEVDRYGASNSPLHAGIGTDRLIVSWWIEPFLEALEGAKEGSNRGAKGHDVEPTQPRAPDRGVELVSVGPDGTPRLHAVPDEATVLTVAIPPSLQALKRMDLERARGWRAVVRGALGPRLRDPRHRPQPGAKGWVVDACLPASEWAPQSAPQAAPQSAPSPAPLMRLQTRVFPGPGA